MKKAVITENAPAPIGPYSQAVSFGDFLFISGQIPLIPGTDELDNANIEAETKRVMQNIEAILKQNGNSFDDVLKTSIFLSNMSHFATVNSIYETYVTKPYPARETIAVLGLPKNVNVEISMIVAKSK